MQNKINDQTATVASNFASLCGSQCHMLLTASSYIEENKTVFVHSVPGLATKYAILFSKKQTFPIPHCVDVYCI